MANPTTSPISKVDDDILLSIFDTFTSEMPALDTCIERIDRLLTFIHTASRVCWRWRGLILSSPWIWGRLIDLDRHWDPIRIDWMEEVIKRAGSAPLWIHGRVIEERFPPLNFVTLFIRFLESSWERVEKLSVLVCVDQWSTIEDIQNRFLRRAPILKVFEVRFIDNQEYISLYTSQPGPSRSLFADHAPSPQGINTEQMPYTSDASWLSNLRRIDCFPSNSDLKDIFGILHHTPLIERIVFNSQRPENRLWPKQVAFPTLSLPRLSSIEVNSTYLEVLAGILIYVLKVLFSCIDKPFAMLKF